MTAAVAKAPGLPASQQFTARPGDAAEPSIDTNVYLSRWPFRRLPGDEPAELVAKLRGRQVQRAWAGSFDGLFHRDLAAANDRLVRTCRELGDGLLVPFGAVNPTLPDWEDDLRRCHELHGMPGIRLHPNYHGYPLDDPRLARLLELAIGRRLIVQLALSMEDERTQHASARVPHVDAMPLARLVSHTPGLRWVLLNAFRALRVDQVGPLAAAGDVYFDIAMLEGVGGVSRLVEQVTAARVLFGSYYPMFYFESAALKVQESPLSGADRAAILAGNAGRLCGPVP
jgi:hypothetical protein